jgi:predicted DsbA family dithiol-disulfide isomerase
MSLEACEYAAEAGRFEEFHRNLLESYFTACENIGDMNILIKTAEKSGLDKNELLHALNTGRYTDKLKEAADEATEKEIGAVPTFLIGESGRISGIQPREIEREIEKAGGG